MNNKGAFNFSPASDFLLRLVSYLSICVQAHSLRTEYSGTRKETLNFKHCIHHCRLTYNVSIGSFLNEEIRVGTFASSFPCLRCCSWTLLLPDDSGSLCCPTINALFFGQSTHAELLSLGSSKHLCHRPTES